MTITDVLGRRFDFRQPPRRVVSLVPSLTETLFALGAGQAVVGITKFCIFPEGIERTRVGGTKSPNVDAIRALAPDLVYVNLEENLKQHADAIAAFAPVFASEPKTVDEVATLIAILGAIHRCEQRASELVAELNSCRHNRAAFSFVVPIWKRPWMWCGGDTYVSNLVESTGARSLLRDRTRYPTIELQEILALKPDVVFLPDEPYEFTEEDARAIRGGPIVVGPFPGHLFTWHGVRTIQGLRFLEREISNCR